jgi:hypothetical protein
VEYHESLIECHSIITRAMLIDPMDEPKDQKPISENPSPQEMKALLPAIKVIGSVAGVLGRLGIKREAFLDFKLRVDDIGRQARILDLPDRFNAAFGSSGWITVGSALSVDAMNSALDRQRV